MARFDQWRNVTMMARFDEAAGDVLWTDEKQFPNQWAANGNAVSVSSPTGPFGGTCAYVDGAGDRIYRTDAAYAPSTSDFTLEGWFRPDWTGSATDGRVFQLGTNASQGGLWITRDSTSNKLIVKTHDTVGYRTVGGGSGTPTISDLTWHYLTLTRRDEVYYFFVDGVLLTTVDETGQDANTIFATNMMFGANDAVAEPIKGHYSDWRLTKGVALYTTGFTAPTAVLEGSGYVLDTQLVNRDFEDPAAWTGGLPTGWTRHVGTSAKGTVTDDGGTTSLFQPTAIQNNIVYQDINVPATAKKLRWNGRLKSVGSDWDESYVGIVMYDATGLIVGGAVAAMNTNSPGVYETLYQEAWVPATAVTAQVVAGNNRQDGTLCDAHVAGCELWWLEDVGYTPYLTDNAVENGDFSNSLTGWSDSSGHDDVGVVVQDSTVAGWLNNYVARRSIPNTIDQLIGTLEQTDIAIPVGSQGLTLSCIAKQTDSGDNARARLSCTIRDATGTLLDQKTAWGQNYSDTFYLGNALDFETLPAGAAKVDVAIDWWQGDQSNEINRFYVSDVQLVFYNETTPFDESEQVYVRKSGNTWFHINPIFGPGYKGLVPDPVTVTSQKFLRDDATWQEIDVATGAGDSNVDGGRADTVYFVMNIDGGGA